MADNVVNLLCSKAKLDRDRGVTQLETLLSSELSDENLKGLEASIQTLLGDREASWETKHGALMGCKCLVTHCQQRNGNDEFAVLSKENGLRLLEDSESRVRLAAGELMGILCEKYGPEVYLSVKDKVLEGVKCNLERQPLVEADVEEQRRTEQLVEKLAGSQRENKLTDAQQIFHDTAGWKSLETWMKCLQCMIDGCASSFNPYIEQVVEFYILQTEADNHAVREAACACIAELGAKVERDVVRPHVARLLDALIVCFQDESWPVRDASCVACGNFILCFPDEARSNMVTLYPLFYENLQDNIPSVRQGAAVALANVVRAYGREALDPILEKLKEGFAGVENQPANAEKYSGLEKGPATYGVVKKMRDNDMELHTDKQMYSCGSLAPKMHRGKRGGGCMDHQFKRPSEPWELTDGCVYLLGELSQVQEAHTDVSSLLPQLSQTASHQHYTQHLVLLETTCKQLPTIGRGIGKRVFKMHLESFFEPIFYSLSCDNALTSAAASQCLSEISAMIGPNILRGRVEQYNPRYVERLPQLGAPFTVPTPPYGAPAGMPIPGGLPPFGSPPGMAIPGAARYEAEDFRPGSHNAPLGASPPATSFMRPFFGGM